MQHYLKINFSIPDEYWTSEIDVALKKTHATKVIIARKHVDL